MWSVLQSLSSGSGWPSLLLDKIPNFSEPWFLISKGDDEDAWA